jgi:hypothetical protein
MGETRRALLDVFRGGRLATVTMGVATAGARRVPGLGYCHGYAALGYDEDDDSVTLWNPWSDDFDPHGAPGLEHGFVTRLGVFRLPLRTLYLNFAWLDFETADPVEPVPQAGPRPGLRD